MASRTTTTTIPLLNHLLRPLSHASSKAQRPLIRCVHAAAHQKSATPIPPPTPFVPDAATFLTLIGRQLAQHASKFSSWEALFRLSSAQLRELGVEPARSRRYLLWWRDRFRRGEYGVGGDLAEVADGVAELRVLERGGRRVLVNVKPETAESVALEKEAVRPVGVKVEAPGIVKGAYIQAVKGGDGAVARLKVQEGMWEVKRGRKIHGGERRRKNVLSRIAARARGTLH